MLVFACVRACVCMWCEGWIGIQAGGGTKDLDARLGTGGHSASLRLVAHPSVEMPTSGELLLIDLTNQSKHPRVFSQTVKMLIPKADRKAIHELVHLYNRPGNSRSRALSFA